MLDILFKSQIGLLSVATIVGAIVVVGAWAVYFIKKQGQDGQEQE